MSKRQWTACAVFLVLTVLCMLECGLNAICLRNIVFLGALIYLSLFDLQYYIIPDKCLLIAVLAWFCAIPFALDAYGGLSGVISAILSAVFYGGGILLFTLAMDRLLKKETMGGGDIKLFAVAGLYLGLMSAVFATVLACILGLCFTALRRKSDIPQMPFGPSIAIACWTMLLYGEPLVTWYMHLMY